MPITILRLRALWLTMFVLIVALLLLTLATGSRADDNVVQAGSILAQIVQWGAAAFGTAIAALVLAVLKRIMDYFGVQTTQQQRDQLQSIIVNGLNDAALKSEDALNRNPNLKIQVKSQIMTDAVAYAQKNGAETIKALGLDPQSGQAVAAIRARIATAISDDNSPTPAVLDTPVLNALKQ